MSQFRHELSNRISETQDNLARAREDGDEYLVGVRLGELESLARVAAEHGVQVAGVEESLARHVDHGSRPVGMRDRVVQCEQRTP